MNRYRAPYTGASRASATTLCQKCLQRGHYSYECKAPAQERPYVSRPSRSQQFANPKLQPKLSEKAPPEDVMNKKSITSKQITDSAAPRGRKRSLDSPMEDAPRHRKRSRSASSYSSTSVSTISTRDSRSPSPRRSRPTREEIRNDSPAARGARAAEKRRRRTSSVSSDYSDRRYRSKGGRDSIESERNIRARRRSQSPAERGRRRSKSVRSTDAHQRSGHRAGNRDDDHIMSDVRPQSADRRNAGERREGNPRGDRARKDSDGRSESGRRARSPPAARPAPAPAPAPAPRRERSLSPFSKRVALTKAMNGGG